MSDFFASGRAADVVLLFMVAEAALIVALGRRFAAGRFRLIVANLAAGASLVVALRMALTGQHWMLIAAALLAAMLAHLAEVWLRFGS